MIYKFHCNLCLRDQELEEEFYIINIIKFSVNLEDNTINYLCEDCQSKINYVSGVKHLENKINAVNKSIQDHASGVQNVYELFNKITSARFISEFEAIKRTLLDEMKKIKKQVEECEEFMRKGYKKMSAINDLYSIKDIDDKLISKIASIVNCIKLDEDF